MSRLFLSDMHLSDPQSAQFRTFARVLQTRLADEIYLLGDLCEVWVGDDDDGPLARAFVNLLAAASQRADVFVMHGNRDFLLGERFAREAGVTLIPDPFALSTDILLAHGDAFCIDDADYQQVRRTLRDPAWQQGMLQRPLEERRALAHGMREQSRVSNANKAENIMDVSAPEVARVMTAGGASCLIHGHTHRPGIHPADWGRRYVLGSWEHCGWLLEEDNEGALTLSCLPLDAD